MRPENEQNHYYEFSKTINSNMLHRTVDGRALPLRGQVSVARGDSRRRHETDPHGQGSGRASAECGARDWSIGIQRDSYTVARKGGQARGRPGHRVHTLRGGTSPVCTLRRAGLPCFECRNTSRGYGASPLYFPINPGPSEPSAPSAPSECALAGAMQCTYGGARVAAEVPINNTLSF